MQLFNYFFTLLAIIIPFCGYAQLNKELRTYKKEWIKQLHDCTLDQNIKNHYLKKSTIYVEDKPYQGYTSISGQLAILKTKIDEIKTFTTVELVEHNDRNLIEIGFYENRIKSEKQYYIIAWTKVKNKWYRELEIIYSEIETSKNDKIVDKSRERWEKYSNAHQPKTLVDKTYWPEANYLNNEKLVRGTTAISERYNYMKKEDWEIKLTPLHIERVQPKLVYEIGQYQSTGIGHYLIVWQKRGMFKWKALLDFNF